VFDLLKIEHELLVWENGIRSSNTWYIYIHVYSVAADTNISQRTKHTLNHSYWKVSVVKYTYLWPTHTKLRYASHAKETNSWINIICESFGSR